MIRLKLRHSAMRISKGIPRTSAHVKPSSRYSTNQIKVMAGRGRIWTYMPHLVKDGFRKRLRVRFFPWVAKTW